MNAKKMAVVVLGAALGCGCSRPKPAGLSFSGTVEMTEHNVGARVAGRLARLLVDQSDPVEKGQLLGWLDRYEKAKRDRDRVVGLFKQGGATRQQVEEAELVVEDQSMVSPVAGVVLVKVREEGEVVPAGGPVFDVGDASDFWVRVFVPEGLVNRVRVGQPAEIRLDGRGEVLRGRVDIVAPQAEFTPRNVQTQEERVLQSFAVKVSLETPPDFVRPGVAADVTLKE